MVENGNYTLKASPIEEVGGLYATGNGTFKIVTVAPNKPPSSEHQTWTITAVGGKENIYTIVLFHKDVISPEESWALEDINAARPSGPIVTVPETADWRITPTNFEDTDIPDTYYIQPVVDGPIVVGVDYYVGTDHKKEVVIIPIPVVFPSPPKPYWQIVNA